MIASPLDRRHFLQRSLGAGAALAAYPWTLAHGQTAATPVADPRFAAAAPGLITKRVERTGDILPALGLGTFLTFDLLPGAPRTHLADVARRYWEAGVRVLDTSPLYGSAEVTVGDLASASNMNEQLFIANKLWVTGDFLADDSHALRSLQESQLRLWRKRFDVMQCHSLVNVDVAVPLMNLWKKEGFTRLVGVTHHENAYHEVLAKWVQQGSVDFVHVNYSIANRHAEQTVLAAAQQRGVSVLVNMAMEKGRLHKAIGNQPLPDFARELGIANWAQYFLKFVMSHPAVTCCLSSTANPAHAEENLGALRGPLPDADMRERMARYVQGLPGFSQVATLPWYPDKQQQYQGLIRRAQAAQRART
ncbi:aldo/keto reductase [Pigmentiphaga aceris]|uniref:Aldo/keto reductase n=1 Tax=Pigmentiphaga aceris TaxID=1940612 RepID=A0A5C0B654_9BURK|nr:aldo/keto reductase [Pigmentiphaga aceris]